MKCEICGELHSKDEGVILKGGKKTYFICNECNEQDYYSVCSDCGKLESKDNGYITFDNRFICNDCYIDNYFMCDKCGEIHHTNDMVQVNEGDHIVCDTCATNYYFQCSCCGCYYSRDKVYIDDRYTILCEDCINDYYICESCGCFIETCDVYWLDDVPYCQECYEERISKDIYERHSFDDYRIMYSELDKTRTLTGLTIGLEIEVEGSKDYATEFLDSHSNMRDMVHLELDSSVEGFEIVTQPMTKNYVDYEFRHCIDKGLDVLKQNGFKGHNCGGIHIHVSGYGRVQLTTYRLKRLLYNLDSNQQRLFLALTQRTRSDLEEWASNNVSYDISMEYAWYQNTRYEAINVDERTSTLEFRIFNSNLRIERIFKNIEMVYALLDYINSDNWTSSSDLYDWMQFVYDNNVNYPNLYLFIEEKHLREKYTRPILKMYSNAV